MVIPKHLLQIRGLLLCLLAFLLLSLGKGKLSAQTIEVQAPKTVVVGELFSVQYRLDNIIQSSNPINPSFSGLELKFGPVLSKSSQTYNINGRISSKTSHIYTYTFIADTEGSFTIKGFSIETDKGLLKGRNIKVKVIAPSKSSESQTGIKPFLLSKPSQTSVYQNEALTIDYKLYVENLRFRYDPLEPIKYEDVIAQDVELEREDRLDKEKVHGSIYNALTLTKQIIIPKTVGTLQLPTIETAIYVPIPSQDVFFSTEERRIKLKSKAQSLKVLPLPSEGRPIDFSGAVGQFQMKASFDTSQELETNKAYNLKLHIEGLGNLKSASLPKINFPTSFETYPATSEQKLFYDKAMALVRSTADIEYSFIPRAKGNFTIPALSFSFFNPKTKQYETLKTEAFELTVKKGKDTDFEGIVQEANYSNSLLSKYRQERGVSSMEGLDFLNLWYFLAYLIIILITAFAIVILLRYRALRQDVLSFKARQANAVALKRLKLAKTYAEAKNRDAFYEELLRALWGYVGDKFRMPTSMLSRENIQELFDEKGFDTDITQAYCLLLDNLEFARYTPQKEKGELINLYEKSVKLISMIESNK